MLADLTLLKEEMKEAKVLKTSAPSVLRKNFKGATLQDKLRKNDLLLLMYTPSKIMPARIGSLIINYKLFEAFLKKIKSFERRIVLTDHSLKVEYWKLGNKTKGVLELEDISYYFEGFKHIPVADIELDG